MTFKDTDEAKILDAKCPTSTVFGRSSRRSTHRRPREDGLDGLGAAGPADDCDAVAFLDRNIRRRLEQDVAVLTFQRDDKKRARGRTLQRTNGSPMLLLPVAAATTSISRPRRRRSRPSRSRSPALNSGQYLGDVLIQ